MNLLDAANKTIEKLQAKAAGDPLDNPLLRATGYRTDINEETKEMRMVFYHGGVDNILGWMTFPITEIYHLSSVCLKHYDKLEGIK